MNKEIRECVKCGKKFAVDTRYEERKYKKITCSYKCYQEHKGYVYIERDLETWYNVPVIDTNLIYAVEGVKLFKDPSLAGDKFDPTTINMSPDYQRPLVWSLEQKQNFVLFILKGGKAPICMNLNHYRHYNNNNPEETFETIGELEVIDGQQRLNALMEFYEGKFSIMYKGQEVNNTNYPVKNINVQYMRTNFKTKEEVVQHYIDMNSAGSIHEEKDIEKAQEILNKLK